MPEAFLTMREWMFPNVDPPLDCVEEPIDAQVPADAQVIEEAVAFDETGEALCDVRRFRAALADAVEIHAQTLLADIACHVLARELELRACDVDAIVRRALERYDATPISIRVNPGDVDAVRGNWPIQSDPSLRPGDAVIVTSAGTIDARLGVRVQRLLGVMEQR